MGLVDSLHALNGCVILFHRCLSAHVPGDVIRLLQEAARADLDYWHDDFLRAVR